MPFVDPDTIHRASTGAVAPAAWGATVNDLLNYLYSSGYLPFSGSAVISSYATGGSVVNYGVTFASAPNPTLTPGDLYAGGAVVPVPLQANNTTTSFKVKVFDMSGAEIAAGSTVRINWYVGANV